jgi:hypothetical protein
MKDQYDAFTSSPTTLSPKTTTGPLGNVTDSATNLKPESVDLVFSASKTLASMFLDEDGNVQVDKLSRRKESNSEGSFCA